MEMCLKSRYDTMYAVYMKDWCTCHFLSDAAFPSKSFMVGSDAAELPFYGCTVSVPPGALEEDTEISLEFIRTDLRVISPVLQLEPSNLNFNRPLTVNLPVVVCPHHTIPEAEWPELILMCCKNGKWSEIQSTKFKFKDLTFECSHFSAYCWTFGADGESKWVKMLTCLLYKGVPKENKAKVEVSICDNLPNVIEVNIICKLHVILIY